MELFAYVIMTNHVHCILRSKNESLSDLVRDFKKFTAKSILSEIENNPKESRKDWLNIVFAYHAKFNKRTQGKQFWTRENHAVELSDNNMIDSKVDYIHNNPVEAGWVANAEDYLYSSARSFSGLGSLIEVDEI